MCKKLELENNILQKDLDYWKRYSHAQRLRLVEKRDQIVSLEVDLLYQRTAIERLIGFNRAECKQGRYEAAIERQEKWMAEND